MVMALRGTMELVGAARGRIWAASGSTQEPKVAVGYFDTSVSPEQEAGLHMVSHQGKALCIPEGCEHYAVLIPMKVEDHVLGVMEMTTGSKLQDEDLALIEVVGQQAGMALTNARLWRDLEQKESVRRHLLARAITAQEERRRIAREIHDEASQSLTRLLLEVDAIMLHEADGSLAPSLKKVREFAVHTLDQLHSLGAELRPTVLDEIGLVPAIFRYLESFRQRTGLGVDFQAIGVDDLRLIPPAEIAIYRIVQEACLNVVRHASATCVSVLMERKGDQMLVIIEGNGVGFDVEAIGKAPVEDRLGVLGMEERSTLVGGELTIESWPGRGTTLYLRVPLRGNAVGTRGEDSDRNS